MECFAVHSHYCNALGLRLSKDVKNFIKLQLLQGVTEAALLEKIKTNFPQHVHTSTMSNILALHLKKLLLVNIFC